MWCAAGWARQAQAAAAASQMSEDDRTYGALYPDLAAAHAAADERDEARRRAVHGSGRISDTALYEKLFGAADPPGHGPVPGHKPMTAQHAHEHSDYAGGVHDHVHTHTGDASHEPGTNHLHKESASAADGPKNDPTYRALFGED